jgi:hypothetical protein
LIEAIHAVVEHHSAAVNFNHMNKDESRAEKIKSRCERILKALDDCPKSGTLQFYQGVKEILKASRDARGEELQVVDRRLDDIVKNLQVTKDAKGEEILGFRRWEKFMS